MLTTGKSKLEKNTPAERIYDDICRDITDNRLQPGSKLLSEAALTKLYQANVYQIRQAVQLLKEAGRVYTVPKVGVFIAPIEGDGAAGPESGFFEEEVPVPEVDDAGPCPSITFKTGHNFPPQRAAWEEILKAFHKQNGFCRVEMDYEVSAGPAPRPEPPPDVCECSRPVAQYQIGDMPLLNIRDFFLDSAHDRMKFLDDHALLSGYFTHFLFYNRRLLDQHGFAPPGYRDFAGQRDYLTYHLEAVAQNGAFTATASTQQPVTRMGKYLGMLFRALGGGHGLSERKFMELFAEPCEQLVALRRQYRISPPRKAAAFQREFLDGRTPFFLGTSSDVRLIRNAENADEFVGYPLLSIDGSLCRLALPLVIHAGTAHPIECLRLARFLQDDFAQRKLGEQGFLPIHDDLRTESFRRDRFDNQSGEIIFFRSPEEHYICTNILNVELWDCVLNGKTVAKALNNSRMFAKAYLDLKMAPKQVEERRTWMELYS